MKLLHFVKNDRLHLGVQTDRGVLDVSEALAQFPAPAGLQLPTLVDEIIEGGTEALAALASYLELVNEKGAAADSVWLREDELTYGPCVSRPNKIICVGLNYRKHAEETNAPIPEYPILFNKFHNALAAHNDDVPLPKASSKVDYEAELVIVMGRKAKDVEQENALDYVFGYCNGNDLSARDLQTRTAQWMLGKTCDKFSPIGPYVVTSDEVGNPNQLEIKCLVNGEVRQHSNTEDMIFHCDQIVSYISRHMTLVPGDLILTGTPEGVVLGYPPEKQVYLQDGDEVAIQIEKLGVLTNRMVAE
ncbi:fumarylacetoacetate hydrolase family protein [Paenibacillus turpanensis]|uniref:fumarylacetoacetate hydrolase family protein n=1 Tax=Paenibacillus turpanensis TaxID=2689078 RepID=UPI0014087E59|nr:fumarylacetoacetate hydrolase family protein [Paenibacillus turpanensis]